MPDIADAVEWRNLLPLSVPVLAYVDGPVSQWPTEALQALGGRIQGSITVLADERFEIFDSEAGNAGTDRVATAIANRLQDRLPSIAYTNQDNLPGLSASLRRKGVHWTDGQFYPEPGCYLFAADPGVTPGTIPAWCPVSPVAVQDRWLGGYDLSTTHHAWPVPAKPAPPPPPIPALEDDMFVMVRAPSNATILFNGRDWSRVIDQESLAAFEKAGIKLVNVTDAQFRALVGM